MPGSKIIPQVAYFSMEIALENNIKTYSGGLGVLAGDILRSAADQKFSMVGVTLLSDEGYCEQRFNQAGEQEESPSLGYDFSHLEKLPVTADIIIGSDQVRVGVWRYLIRGESSGEVPVYLLDTKFPENPEIYRGLTGRLYGGDEEYRLLQAIVLGRGGWQILKALGYQIDKIHINEGHAAFAALAHFLNSRAGSEAERLADTKQTCVFTTHTPLRTARNIFPASLVLKYQSDFPVNLPGLLDAGRVDMIRLALYFSNYANAVSKKHQQLTSLIFPSYHIRAVTNGVHSLTWTSPEFKSLYDKFIPGWRHENHLLRGASSMPLPEIRGAHQAAKRSLIDLIKDKAGLDFSEDIFTIGFARRFAIYKRPGLLLQDLASLLSVQERVGKMQIVYSGKAHPADQKGKEIISAVNQIKQKYRDKIKLAFIENYDLDLAKIIIAGVDLWLNTPLPPNEASGTSGMKAAHNGVPQLSTLDGWWLEGYVQGKTGWAITEPVTGDSILSIGERHNNKNQRDREDSSRLYDILEKEIIPLYYNDPEAWLEMMRSTIGINAAYFNTDRVLREYRQQAYS